MKKPISIAPMMDWTDRHCRFFLRLLGPQHLLYTEMVTAAAIVHGDADRLMRYDASEHPIALQLGGSNPDWMAAAAEKAQSVGFDEININVGCPSDRVQSGQFGACLMASPKIVASCYRAMSESANVPITVKSRIGIDDQDNDAFFCAFIDEVAAAGCRKFVVHARIAILEGLSPKQNRTVPPLNYDRVLRLKQDRPELEIVLNGGLTTLNHVETALAQFDGAMIGRQAYQKPYFLAELQHHLDPTWARPERRDIVLKMLPYIEAEIANGESLSRIVRHMLGLFADQPGARAWRRHISENASEPGAGPEVLMDALAAMAKAAETVTMAGPVETSYRNTQIQ